MKVTIDYMRRRIGEDGRPIFPESAWGVPRLTLVEPSAEELDLLESVATRHGTSVCRTIDASGQSIYRLMPAKEEQ